MAGMSDQLPVIVVGAGPVGLTTALGLSFYGLRFELIEEDDALSKDTKAGGTLTRSIEIFRRYGVADEVLQNALRIDEIADIDRATNKTRLSVETYILNQETRYPFVLNMPQHHLEPILERAIRRSPCGTINMQHRVVGLRQLHDRVVLDLETARGPKSVEGQYVLACDGGRSTVRRLLGIQTDGSTLEHLYLLIDVKIDLDIDNPRDYPYLAYFSDRTEWMILVRQPHCWRFLFPVAKDAPELTTQELRQKVAHFIGETTELTVLGKNLYAVHHRVAQEWRNGRVFLMGDAAHLITPMWQLGMNTGILDANSLPWRLAWVLRGWAGDSLLDGYEREQRPIAVHGAAQIAENARKYMSKEVQSVAAMTENSWGNAYTRALLGVHLDVDRSGDTSMIKSSREPLRSGDRFPDWAVHAPNGREHRIHDFNNGNFLALYFADVRRRPPIPVNDCRALRHFVVSRWDAPLDGGLRDRSLLDLGDGLLKRAGCPANTLILIRPDDHIAAIEPITEGIAQACYERAVGAPLPSADLEPVDRR
jgi:3-(3-hydroxy-phenyl)propionate hydroxylase